MTDRPDLDLIAYRLLLAYLKQDEAGYDAAIAEAGAHQTDLITHLVHGWADTVECWATIDESQRDELLHHAAVTDPGALRADAVAYVLDNLIAPRVIANMEGDA